MPTEITLRVQSDLLPPTLVEGVFVRAYQPDGTFVTEGTTDDDGEVLFLLPAGAYDLLFFKQGFAVVQPQRITVVEDDPAIYRVAGHLHTLQEAVDPLYCRVSGYLRDLLGRSATDLNLQLEAVSEVLVANHILTSPGTSKLLRPDSSGLFQFDLLRGQKYNLYPFAIASMLGVSPAKIEVLVPNTPAVSLDSLLFPVPTSFTFSVDAKTLHVGDPTDMSVLTTVTHSDGNVRQNALVWGGVKVTNTDGSVVEAVLGAGMVMLRPLKPGTAVISAERAVNDKVQFLPQAPAFTAGTLAITVE
jgi:hypothetical protein